MTDDKNRIESDATNHSTDEKQPSETDNVNHPTNYEDWDPHLGWVYTEIGAQP